MNRLGRAYIPVQIILSDNVLDSESHLIQHGATKIEADIDYIEVIIKILKDITDERRRKIRINSIIYIISLLTKSYIKSQDLLYSIIESFTNEEVKDRVYNFYDIYIDEPKEIDNITKTINLAARNQNVLSHDESCDSSDNIDNFLCELIIDTIMHISLSESCNTEILYRLERNNYWKIKDIKAPILLLKDQYILSKIDNIDININICNNKGNSEINLDKSYVLFTSDLEGLINKITKEETIVLDASNDKNIVRINEYKEFKKNKVFPLDNYEIDYKNINVDISRLGILLYGPPGTGKTCWCYSFYDQVLRKKGYILVILNYQRYKDLSLYIKGLKCCVLVNDVDFLEDNSSRAQVLSKLEKEYGKSIITLMTVNSIEYLDDAFRRKGRIDHMINLTKSFV